MATFTVTALSDELDAGLSIGTPGGTGLSLREAIQLTNASAGADTIVFAPNLKGGTIRLTNAAGMLAVSDELYIDGDIGLDLTPDIKITGDAAGNDALSSGFTNIAASQLADTLSDNVQIFAAAAKFTLSGVLVTGGVSAGNGGAVSGTMFSSANSVFSGNRAGLDGGAVYGNDVQFLNSTLSGNSAGADGGAAASSGWLYFLNVTVANNQASNNSGGADGGTVTLIGSTFTGNTAAVGGGGLRAGDLTLTNSIVLGNHATSLAANSEIWVNATLTTTGGNIVGTNVLSGSLDVGDTSAAAVFAQIDPTTSGGLLADNGGRVPTVALNSAFANPALDRADNNSYGTDSRGFSRADLAGVPNANGTGIDLGAYEVQSITPPVNTLPSSAAVEANKDGGINGLAVFDAEVGILTTTLSVAHGTLKVLAGNGATVFGSGTDTVTLTGTATQINFALGAPDNLIYHGNKDFFGTETMAMKTTDSGGLSDTDVLNVNVKSLIAGTPNDDSFAALPGNERINAGGGIDTVTFNFKLTEAKVAYSGNTIIIDGPTGSHTVLNGVEKFVFSDGTVDNNDGNWLVDDLFYYSRNHDVWNAHADAETHYNTTGWKAGLDPSAFFSTSLYLQANQDVKTAGINPLEHFHATGWKEGRVSSLNFDAQEYLKNYADVAAAKVDPLEHFMRSGAGEGRLTFAPPADVFAANGFDYVYYLQNNPDVAAAGVDAFQHFQTMGWKEGRNPNVLFDTAGYLAAYGDVKAAGINPLDHYHQFGWKEGRDPSVGFDSSSYLAAYPDVAAAKTDPLLHYIHFGMHEGRSAFADGVWG